MLHLIAAGEGQNQMGYLCSLYTEVGKRGFAVKSFSEKECWEALELRALLEGQAARLLAQQGASEQVLDALDECQACGQLIDGKMWSECREGNLAWIY